MELLSTPGEAQNDPEGNGSVPEVQVDDTKPAVNDETPSTHDDLTETKAEEPELTKAVAKDQTQTDSDSNELMTGRSISSEVESRESASPIIETATKCSPEETTEESPPSDNNSHLESEPKHRPRIDTPDFSMGIYSMDLPPATPKLQLNDDLDLKTPKMESLEVKSSEGESSTSASPNETDTTRALHETTPLQSNGFNSLGDTQQTPTSLFHAVTEESSIQTTHPNATTPSVKKAGATSKTLAALFGGPSIGSAPGDYSSANLNNLAAQHDYTLVGDSPYETTYDPQSTFYYNRVYGQLYITTISVMFRGKAFGPIGAIPYERRLLLPFLEISEIHAYKSTSVKITMNDSESYVFKGFANREAMVKLLRRTKRKCNEMYKQRRHTTSIVPAAMSATKPNSEASIRPNTNSTPRHSSHATTTPGNSALLHPSETNEKQHRRSRTPNSVKNKQNKHSDLRRRSSSMPSSLREAKAARVSSKSASGTPQRNSVFFDDETIGNKENSDAVSSTSETKTPSTQSKPVPVGSLRLSLQDGDSGQALNTEEKELNRPRRLFEVEPNAMLAANATAAAVMLSPPRTRISQRKQPKTPQVASGNETPNNNGTSNAAKNNDSSRHIHRRDQSESSRKNNIGGTLASIPSIPTVPSLNTPDLSSQRKIIKLEASRVARGTAIPVPIPEMVNDDTSPSIGSKSNSVGVAPRVLAPVTPIAKHSPAPTPQDIMLEKAWKAERIVTSTKEWTVAMESTTLPNCTLDEWFELFFSNDAFFSLARYQLEHIGDRDVSFHPWRQTQNKKSPEEKKCDSYEPVIPELEREIRYIHPIGGSMIGPSEAETFRVQSLKRYKHHGIILKNVTTVGKGIPMGDCFRVEDRWNIENHPTECALTISVSFRVVFVKRTMFKSMILKNTLAETKEWFQGYSKMMKTALKSAKHEELIQRRQSYSLVPEEIADSSSTSSSASSMREASVKSHRDLASHALPTCTQSRTHATDTRLTNRDDSKPKPLQRSGNTAIVVLGIGLVVVLLGALGALWLQVRSVSTSLSMVEGALGDLRAQNALLLQKLEELGQPVAENVDASSMATVSSATT